MRIVLFATPGAMALPVLQRLLTLPVAVINLILPAPPASPPITALPPPSPVRGQVVLEPPSLTRLAGQNGIDILALSRAGMQLFADQLAQQRPDLAVVACWPWRIPPALLSVPQWGFLNLHPSPLPALRGPEPLFWALRLGWTRAAMTLHLMDEELDHGPIVAQEWFALPLGQRLSAMEALAGQIGAQMIATALTDLTTKGWQPRPQEAGGSFYPAPQPADLAFTAEWQTQAAYAFARAVAEWRQPLTFTAADGRAWLVADAIDYRIGARLSAPVVAEGSLLALQLRDGALIAQTPAAS